MEQPSWCVVLLIPEGWPAPVLRDSELILPLQNAMKALLRLRLLLLVSSCNRVSHRYTTRPTMMMIHDRGGGVTMCFVLSEGGRE